MNVYVVMFEAIPSKNNEERDLFGGAFVNCWIKAQEKDEAETCAKNMVLTEGWEIIRTEDVYVTQREAYMEEPDSLACYDEAENDNPACIFYTWPIDS